MWPHLKLTNVMERKLLRHDKSEPKTQIMTLSVNGQTDHSISMATLRKLRVVL